PVAHLRRSLGLTPERKTNAYWRYLVLASTAPSLVMEHDYVSPTTHFIRPEPFDRSGDETLPGWLTSLEGRPTIHATLGTVVSRLRVASTIYDAIVAAVRDEPINVILTVGSNQEPDRFNPGEGHVYVDRYIPHSLLLPHCDLVIAHGGFSTMISSLCHGLPLVVIPVAADQFDNADRVQRAGAGIVIDPDQRTPEAIRAAVRQVLTEPHFRKNAERIRAELESLPNFDHAVSLLERLAVEKQPILAVTR
ncbi:MAG TPA: nucleotide disphospho-sugar-binding domain-containing protein, partial [Thermomicrobiales bacterium]|nr:nucleotide disphospho-sugar-binding domain-containing protein [Thermomicrobiales bacterium]